VKHRARISSVGRTTGPLTANNNVHNEGNVGRQSQHRVSNQHKRKFKQASPRRRRAGDQLTLDNQVAFLPERDCKICKAKEIKKFPPSYQIPHRGHHPLCIHNKNTQGKGELSSQSILSLQDNKRHKVLTAPIRPAEKFSGKFATKAVVESFFGPWTNATKPMTTTTTTTASTTEAHSFGKIVGDLVKTNEFREKHKSKCAPLAMIAFANAVADRIYQQKDLFSEHFKGIEMVVPGTNCWMKKNDVAKMRQAGTAPAAGTTIYCPTSLWCAVTYKLLALCTANTLLQANVRLVLRSDLCWIYCAIYGYVRNSEFRSICSACVTDEVQFVCIECHLDRYVALRAR